MHAPVVGLRLDVPLVRREPAWTAGNLRLLDIVGNHHNQPCDAARGPELPVRGHVYLESIVIGSVRADARYIEARSIPASQEH